MKHMKREQHVMFHLSYPFQEVWPCLKPTISSLSSHRLTDRHISGRYYFQTGRLLPTEVIEKPVASPCLATTEKNERVPPNPATLNYERPQKISHDRLCELEPK